jgi:choline dehydrogenase-like flavoprotein
MLPAYKNPVRLDGSRRDAGGIPALHIDCRYGARDLAVAAELAVALRELADAARVDITSLNESPPPPGGANHDCGTARMGTDRTNSVYSIPITNAGMLVGSTSPTAPAFRRKGAKTRL